jgi:hypothetical protein
MRKVLLFAIGLMLGSCGTLKDPYAPETMAEAPLPAGSGLIIFSTGAARKCVADSTFLKLLPEGAPEGRKELARISVDTWAVKSDFADHQGRLHLMPIAAGSYYFVPRIDNPIVRSILQPQVSFSVSAGERVYLGEYYMPEACTMSTRYEVHDQMTRDIALLESKDPSFDTSKVTKRLMVLSGGVPPCDATNSKLTCY